MHNGVLVLLEPIPSHIQPLGISISKVTILVQEEGDKLICTRSLNAKLSVKGAYEAYREKVLTRT